MSEATVNNYTVILMRPDWASDNFGQEPLLLHVGSETPERAGHVAQNEAWIADTSGHYGRDPDPAGTLEDYLVLYVFSGWLCPVWVGN